MLYKSLITASLLALTLGIASAQTAPKHDTIEQQRAAAQRAKLFAQGQQNAAAQRISQASFQEGAGERGTGIVNIGGVEFDVNKLAPGGSAAEADHLKTLLDDEVALNEAITRKNEALRTDSSPEAEALRIIGSRESRSAAETMADSSLWAVSNGALANGTLQADFADCRSTTTYRQGVPEDGFVSQESTCEQVHHLPNATRTRDVDIREEHATALERTYSPVTARVTDGGVLTHPSGTPFIEAVMTLEWVGNVAAVNVLQEPSIANDWSFEFEILPAASLPLVCRSGPIGLPCEPGSVGCTCTEQRQYANVAVNAVFTTLVETIASNPIEPLMATDGWCTARWACTDSAPRTIGGVVVDQNFSHGLSELYPYNASTNMPASSQTPLCWAATAVYDCPFNMGQICWTDASGSRRCSTNDPTNTTMNTCGAIQGASGCSRVQTKCNEDAVGHNGFCYVSTHLYRCTQAVEVPTIVMQQANTCAGAVRCAGDNCLGSTGAVHLGDYAEAAARRMLVQHIFADRKRPTQAKADTTSTDPNDPNSILMMPGKAFECRKQLGGSLNCCKVNVEGEGQEQWLKVYREHMRQSNAKAVVEVDDQPAGLATRMAQSRQHTLGELRSGLLTSNTEAIYPMGNLSKAYQPPPQGLEIGQDTSIETAMAIYRSEQMEAQQNGWYCSAEELDLSLQREAGACSFVGSYCANSVLGACLEKRETYMCFNSPLSRIAQEYIHRDTENPFGTAKKPVEPTIKVTGLESTGLDALPTNEIKGVLTKMGMVPDHTNVEEFFSEEKLTGARSSLGQPDRKTLGQRTAETVAKLDTTKILSDVESEARGYVYEPPKEQSAGDISMGPAHVYIRGVQVAKVHVSRTDTKGSVAVSWRTEDGTAKEGTHYSAASGTIRWADGDRGSQTISIPIAPRSHQGRAAPADLRFKVHLHTPTGGARIYPTSEADIVLSSIRSDPPAGANNTVGGLRVTKRPLGIRKWQERPGSRSDYRVDWDIEIQNATGHDIVSLYIADEPPVDPANRWPQDHIPLLNVYQWNDTRHGVGDDYFSRACFDQALGQRGTYLIAFNTIAGWCQTSLAIRNGQTVRIGSVSRFFYPGDAPRALHRNVCRVSATLANGKVIDIGTDKCHATVSLEPDPIDREIECAASYEDLFNQTNYYSYRVFGFEPTFGFGFGQGSATRETRSGSGVNAIEFTTSIKPEEAHGTFASSPGTQPPTAPYAYMKISPCVGDVTLPSQGAESGSFQQEACTSVRYDGSGGIASASTPIRVQVGGEAEPGVCRLERNRTYYLNFVTDDPSDGLDESESRQLCRSQPGYYNGCAVTISVSKP
jgi:conjugal transfer mating pair stabilization protein TraN